MLAWQFWMFAKYWTTTKEAKQIQHDICCLLYKPNILGGKPTQKEHLSTAHPGVPEQWVSTDWSDAIEKDTYMNDQKREACIVLCLHAQH